MNTVTIIAIVKILVKAIGQERIDQILNNLEEKYKEGTIKDVAMETAMAVVRKSLDVPDSDPDN